MRVITFLLLLTMSFSAPHVAAMQRTPAGVNARGVVEKAEVSGIDEGELGQDIRDAIHKLEGKAFDQQAADDLVVRIQAEIPKVIATTRLQAGSTADLVKVVFDIEKTDEKTGGDQNVNSRYMVERVEVQGYDESKLSQDIRDEMQKLVGEKLNQDKANEILHEIDRSLRPRHYAVKRISKGSDPQHIVVIFEIRKVRWIPFLEIPTQRVAYHSKQNFSFDVTAPIELHHDNRILFGASNDQDELLERFAGFNVGFENTRLGTDRLGIALRYARYHERWQPATVLADRNSVYRERNTFDPSLTFALDPRVRVTAGVSLSDLQIQYPAIHRDNANAATAAVHFRNNWGRTSESRHFLTANYEVRAGNHELDSDFIYTRHLVTAQYAFSHNKDKLLLSFLAGTISGNAPLFERFSLGNTMTLRGWNKFDIAPAGGNRVIHSSLQYGFGKPQIGEFDFDINGNKHHGGIGLGFHVFYDVGAVGNAGSPMQARHSAGFGFGTPNASNFFIELGFPIRSNHFEPTFSMGFRF